MLKLMIVDDSALIRRRIGREFDKKKFELVASATNGEEAITLFNTHRPHIVTMDITMPMLDGIACIEKLIDIDPYVQILVVSALSDQATGMEALEKGATGFLIKPFSEDQIGEALDIMSEDLMMVSRASK
ncbi:MAG: response regulator [Acidiferrobacterales bacterium]|nr:response regulator [Acidiferrobacterales bacterium]